MTSNIPSSFSLRKRSGFSIIDPETELYHHKLGRAQHVAVSYVWSDWTDSPEAGHHLRHWPMLRQRLKSIVGSGATQFMKIESGNATRCWLDCKCINQDSAEDKAYWVPRMHEIYSEARCTVLLLRDVDLSSLEEAERGLACDLDDDDDHACHLAQVCTTLTSLSPELLSRCVETLKAICVGQWRKRAWIFQEILLSKEYILSGEDHAQVKLGDASTIAHLLFQHFPDCEWLSEFASWCRRLFRLRNYYFAYRLCPSNVLQLASSLQATLPCDKYYALCSVLRLKNLKYDSSHSEQQALKAVILGLTKSGRLSWLSAIPSSIHNKISLDGNFLSYVERSLDQPGSLYANTKDSSSSQIKFRSRHIGKIIQVYDAYELLQQAISIARQNPSMEYLPPHLAVIPTLLKGVCREVVDTLTMQPVFHRLCRVLNITEKDGGSTLLMQLLAIESPAPFRTHELTDSDIPLAGTELVASSASSIQHHIGVMRLMDIVQWSPTGKPKIKYFAIGSKGCRMHSSVCKIAGDSLLLAVDIDLNGGDATHASWITTLHQPASSDKEARYNPTIWEVRGNQDLVFQI